MDKKTVSLSDMYAVIKEKIDSGGEVNFNSRGTSMLPMLHFDGDRVILKKADNCLKKYDISLFIRDNGQFVLHRVIKINSNGTYNICGDNQVTVEKEVKKEQIIGVVKAFYRNGKYISCNNFWYKVYCRIWVNTRPLGFIIMKIISKIKKCCK